MAPHPTEHNSDQPAEDPTPSPQPPIDDRPALLADDIVRQLTAFNAAPLRAAEQRADEDDLDDRQPP